MKQLSNYIREGLLTNLGDLDSKITGMNQDVLNTTLVQKFINQVSHGLDKNARFELDSNSLILSPNKRDPFANLKFIYDKKIGVGIEGHDESQPYGEIICIPIDDYKSLGISWNGDVTITYEAIAHGLKLSDLNLVGQRKDITLYGAGSKTLNSSDFKKFLDAAPPVSSVMRILDCGDVSFLDNQDLTKFREVLVKLDNIKPIFRDCRAKILHLINCNGAMHERTPVTYTNMISRVNNNNNPSHIDKEIYATFKQFLVDNKGVQKLAIDFMEITKYSTTISLSKDGRSIELQKDYKNW